MYCTLLPRLANTKREEVSAAGMTGSLGTNSEPRNGVDDEFQFSLQGWQFSTGTLWLLEKKEYKGGPPTI